MSEHVTISHKAVIDDAYRVFGVANDAVGVINDSFVADGDMLAHQANADAYRVFGVANALLTSLWQRRCIYSHIFFLYVLIERCYQPLLLGRAAIAAAAICLSGVSSAPASRIRCKTAISASRTDCRRRYC